MKYIKIVLITFLITSILLFGQSFSKYVVNKNLISNGTINVTTENSIETAIPVSTTGTDNVAGVDAEGNKNIVDNVDKNISDNKNALFDGTWYTNQGYYWLNNVSRRMSSFQFHNKKEEITNSDGTKSYNYDNDGAYYGLQFKWDRQYRIDKVIIQYLQDITSAEFPSDVYFKNAGNRVDYTSSETNPILARGPGSSFYTIKTVTYTFTKPILTDQLTVYMKPPIINKGDIKNCISILEMQIDGI